MRIVCGMIVAPRPEPTAAHCMHSIARSDISVDAFCEPGSPKIFGIYRPDVFVEAGHGITPSPEGVFGNFQNWIQTARDLCSKASDTDAIMIAEDDAYFAPNIMELLQRDLWPVESCGCVSLYCPNLGHYSHRNKGLNRTLIVKADKVGRTENLVGALALVFPKPVLEQLAWHESVKDWHGSHGQASDPRTKPWDRKAVDTWIGRTLISMSRSVWHYSPSLVLHYEPKKGRSNSSMGHSVASRTRQARLFVGDSVQDLTRLFPPRKERYDIHSSTVQSPVLLPER